MELLNTSGGHGGWMIHCPACGCGHLFDARWAFNGSKERPTFRASMLVHENARVSPRCHSFVTDGRIQYLSDCTHAMAGQTVELGEP